MSDKVNKSLGEIQLDYLKKNYNQLARQGSEAWLSGRRSRFGGSEIGLITNKKISTKKFENFCINKVEAVRCSNIFCWWGNLFEDIAKNFLTKINKWEIKEFGAIPSTNYPVAYSPDGVFIDEGELILLEIKCPFIRNTDQIKEIKTEYIKQVQMGMQILPIYKTKFCRFKFRKCFKSQLFKDGKYDMFFHKTSRKNDHGNIKAWWSGAVYWETNDAIVEEYDLNKYPTKIYYSFEDSNFLEKCERYNTGKIMFFKCFDVDVQIIKKDKKFEDKFHKLIWLKYSLLSKYFDK